MDPPFADLNDYYNFHSGSTSSLYQKVVGSILLAMDNNSAEQRIRNPVIGRNNYSGSGSIWSAELAAMQFSIFQTMLLWGINPRTWLHLYLEACAQNKGKPPEDLSEFLPWKMSEARLVQLTKPPECNTS